MVSGRYLGAKKRLSEFRDPFPQWMLYFDDTLIARERLLRDRRANPKLVHAVEIPENGSACGFSIGIDT